MKDVIPLHRIEDRNDSESAEWSLKGNTKRERERGFKRAKVHRKVNALSSFLS